MALTDILNSISEKANEHVAVIEAEYEKKRQALKQELEKKLSEKKEAALKRIQYQATKKESQASWELSSAVHTNLLKKKQTLLNTVFQEAEQQLSNMDDSMYEQFMEQLIKKLPTIAETATIHSAKGKESALKTALNKSGSTYTFSDDSVDTRGGFVVRTADMEIDMTLESIVKQYQAEHEVEIANTLFNA